MKKQIKRFSKSTLAVVLTLCMLLSCVTVGIISTNAAQVGGDSTGATCYLHYSTTDTGMSSATTETLPHSMSVAKGALYVRVDTNPNNSTDDRLETSTSLTDNIYDDGTSDHSGYKYRRLYFGKAMSNVTFSYDESTKVLSVSGAPTYTITTSAGEGGSLAVSLASDPNNNPISRSIANERLKITITPDRGKELDTLTVKGSDNTDITVSGSGNTREFTMPAQNVTATATFKNAASTLVTAQQVTVGQGKIKVAITGAGSATATTSASATLTAYSGENLTVTASPDRGYAVDTLYIKVGSDPESAYTNTSSKTLTIGSDAVVVRATFKVGSSSSNHFTATAGSSITDKLGDDQGDLFLLNGTFYDYYTNNEISGGWITGIQSSDRGKAQSCTPYNTFNSAIRDYTHDGDIKYPLYFLNDQKNDEAIYTYSSTNPTGWNYYKQVNNSMGSGLNTAVTGLTGLTLKNGLPTHYKSGATDENGVDMKIFDEDWLSGGNSQSTTLATIVDSPFPVVKRQTLKGNDYYEFNSNGAADNIWFTNLTPVYDNSSISGNVDATWGDGDATWYAILWSSSQSNSFKYVALNPDSNHDYSLVNPNKNYYDKFLLARVNTSATPPTDGTWIGDGNVYNKTADQNWPNGLDNKLIFNTTGWGSPMGTEWKPDTSATSSRQQIYVNYGSGEDNGVKSPSFGKSGGTWGFFPFDHNTSDGEAWDLGFATKLEIKFTVSEDGTIGEGSNKENQQFYFSGDDDLWVFIDDELVLDLGGNHRMTEGYIDFATKKAHANNSTVAYQGSMVRNDQNGSTFTLDNTKSYHTMTLFYMERGMFDSNLKFGFSFTPLTDLLDVETKVDVSAVNEGLRTQIASKDTFGYTVSDSTNNTKGKNASYTIYNVSSDTQVGTSSYTTNDSGVFNQGIKDGQYAQFKKAFTVGDTISVTETNPNVTGGLQYTTSYKVVDKEITSGDNEVTHGSGTSTGGFSYRTIKENSDPHVDLTHLRAIFTNKVETKNLTITKEISNKYDPDAQFPITVSISMGENALDTTNLKYYKNGTEYTFVNGVVNIKQGEEIEIRGIPKGATVSVTETDLPTNYSYVSRDNDAHTFNGNLASQGYLTLNTDDYVTIVNKIAENDLIIKKQLDSDIVDYATPFKIQVYRFDDGSATYNQITEQLSYTYFEWNRTTSSYEQKTGTLSATGDNHAYQIHNGSRLTIPNLPVDTKIKVIETDYASDYYTYDTMEIAGGATLSLEGTRTGIVTTGSSAATLTIKNKAIRETVVITKTTDYDQDDSLFGVKVEMKQRNSNGNRVPNNNGTYKVLGTDTTWSAHNSSHGEGTYRVKKTGQIKFTNVPRGTWVQITEPFIGDSPVTGNQRFQTGYVHVLNSSGVDPDVTKLNLAWQCYAVTEDPVTHEKTVNVEVNNTVDRNDVIITKNITDAEDTNTEHKITVTVSKDDGDVGDTVYDNITYTSSKHGEQTKANGSEISIVENETLTFAGYPVGTHFEVTETATGANYEFDSFDAQTVTDKKIVGQTITFITTDASGGDNVTINNKLANRTVTVKKEVSNYNTSDKFKILIEKSTDGGSTYTPLANESFTSNDVNRTDLRTHETYGTTTISQNEILTFKLHVSDYIRISEVLNDRPEYDCTSVAVTSGPTGTDYTADGLKGTIFQVGTTDASVVVTNALKDYKYKIVYNYEAYSAKTYTSKTEKDDDHRVVGPIRSYTQKGVISQDDRDYFFNINKTTKEITFKTDDLRKEFISKHAPFEDDFMMDVKWLDEENPKSASYDSTTSTISLETTATSQPDRAVKVYFKMPYNVDSNLAATGDTKKTAVVQDTVTTQYGNWVIMGGDFVTAPRTLNDNGTTSYFQYWQITFITGSDEHGDKVANNTKKCYYDKFNMTMYQDSYVEPIYKTEAEGGKTEFKPSEASYQDTKDGEATISFIETSRSSWNEDGAPDQTDDTKKKAGDRVYSDFLLTFGYKDKQLNTYSGNVDGSNVKIGFVLERVAELDKDSTTGKYVTKSQKEYKDTYDTTVSADSVANYVKGTASPAGFIMKQNIAFSSLDNKNQMKYSLDMKNKEFGEREEPTDPYRNYVYRAYSYTRIGDNVVVSTPVYFTIYDMASIETV